MKTIGTMPEKPLSILVVDQDINWGRFIQSCLAHKGYEVSLATDGLDAWRRIVKGQHNFCILNPDLPTMDGYALAEHIRAQADRIPIVFMVSHQQDSEETRIHCFNAGADDFIVHPCQIEEINLRIKTIQKRFRFCPVENDYRIFDLGRLRFDHAQHRLFNQDCNIRLTTKEAELLLALCLNRGKVLERDQALLAVWKSVDVYNVRSMDVYISKLRRLLFQYTYSEILNVHGVGFKLLTHRDGGFKRILRRDAGRLRQSLPEENENVFDKRFEALAVATSPDGLEAMVEEEGEAALAAEVTQDVTADVAEAVTSAVASAVTPVLREPWGVVSGDPARKPTAEPTGDPIEGSTGGSACASTCAKTEDVVDKPVACDPTAAVVDEPVACEPTAAVVVKPPVWDDLSVGTSMGDPTTFVSENPVKENVGLDRIACNPAGCDPAASVVEKPLKENVGSDGMACVPVGCDPAASVVEKPLKENVGSDGITCVPTCCDSTGSTPTGDSVTTDGGLPDGAHAIASEPPTASSAHKSASSD